jgi:hypothetical protein
MTFVMSLDIDEFIPLITKAVEKREERKAWEMWLMKYQHMDENSFVPFSQFYKNSRKQTISKRSAEEMIAEAEEIRKRVREKEGG